MRYLSLLRHGDCENNEDLTDEGKKQMLDAARSLDGYVSRVLTSSAPRAIYSAEILIAELNLEEFEAIPELQVGERDSKKLIEIIKQTETEGLVLLTHRPVIMHISGPFSKEFINNGHIFVPKCGQGEIYDLKEKTYKKIPVIK